MPRGRVLLATIALLAIAPINLARGQLPSSPEQPPSQPLPAPVEQPLIRPTPILEASPQLIATPLRPLELLEQMGLVGPAECGPAPAGWPELLQRSPGTAPTELRLTTTGPLWAEISWKGALWATHHDVVSMDGAGAGKPVGCYAQWGLPLNEATLSEAGRVAGDVVVVDEARHLTPEVAPALVEPAPSALASMRQAIPNLCYGHTYRFRVVAHYADSAPGRSVEEVSLTTSPAPMPPSLARLAARGITLGADLSWAALPKVYEYRIYRDGRRVGSVQPTQDVWGRWAWPDTTYTDQVAAAGTYSYRVEALLSSCEYAPGPSGEPLAVSTTVSAKALPKPVWGFADTHTHQFANLGFGGLFVWGQPYGPVAEALASDTPAHGAAGVLDVVGYTVRRRNHHPDAGLVPGHLVDGFPKFGGWPTYDTYTHQQYYQDWLKRAVDGGLRLMVMYAVNAEALCKLHPQRARGRTCDDMEAVGAQIDAAKAMQQYIDSQAGGPGKGWYRIVYSPEEARHAIGRGQLAVVLGIEVQSLFNCQPGRVACNTEYVESKLHEYWARGIRQIIPIHNTNNLFGGTAIFRDQYNANNYSLTGAWLEAEACRGSVVEFHLGEPSLRDKALITLIHKDVPDAVPAYPRGGSCNAQGLTALGRDFFRILMRRGMIVDIDHLSQRSFTDAAAIAQEWNYPLLSSHTGLVHVSLGEKRTEFWKTHSQVAQLRGSGGLIGILLHQGRTNEVRTITGIPHDCGNSSKTWAQVYLETVALTGGAPVALASDFGGLVPGLAPRFGKSACDGDGNIAGQSNHVVYPFTGHGTSVQFQKAATGERVFDYNTDGMAHIGMLPDFIEDLKKIGLGAKDLEPLFRSADAYIRMWERIEAITAPPVP